MSRTLEIFTEVGWISNGVLTKDTLVFTPTSDGLGAAVGVMRIIQELAMDKTGELANCIHHLARQIDSKDNDAHTDEEMEDALAKMEASRRKSVESNAEESR